MSVGGGDQHVGLTVTVCIVLHRTRGRNGILMIKIHGPQLTRFDISTCNLKSEIDMSRVNQFFKKEGGVIM